MKEALKMIRFPVNLQPVLRLVDCFEESTEYERNWRLPFNSLSLCVREDPDDPSWVELPETGSRLFFERDSVHFTTCDTPMRIRYTPANLHYCIHFRCELFPGVDLFSGIHARHVSTDRGQAEKIRSVFSEPDPLKRLTRAEAVAMEAVLEHWPEQLPLDVRGMTRFEPLLRYVHLHLDSRLGVPEMAAYMGWSDAYFARSFRSVFRITPKQYLLRELFARAVGLLNDPQKTIRQIAGELKFSSEFNFSRFIRRYSGYSPSELRRGGDSGPLLVRK